MIRECIAKAVEKKDLSHEETREVWEEITGGHATAAQISALITALRMKGETVEEITAAAQVMRNKATRIVVDDPMAAAPAAGALPDPRPLLDTCGTGGDQSHTFNVSTCAAIVAAGAGARVAKHMNRSVSSSCGSADVCEALGINIHLPPEKAGDCIRIHGIGFLFAPALHATMKHAITPRKEIGIRTIFNLLGPLSNPAGAPFQLLGVYHRDLTRLMAAVLGRLGSRRATVVHGEDGMDEITTTGKTDICEWVQGRLRSYAIHPEDFGIPLSRPADLQGKGATENARIILDILQGKRDARRNMVLINTGAALYTAGMADTIREGIALAGESIDSGKAMQKLEAVIEYSRTQETPRRESTK